MVAFSKRILRGALNSFVKSGKRSRPHWLSLVFLSSLLFASVLLLLDSRYPLYLPKRSAGADNGFAQLVVDERGMPLRAFADKNGVWRYPVSIDEVSPLYIEALLNYEDRYFFYHPGVNPFAFVRAAWLNLRYGRIISGGSTITMQVARILRLQQALAENAEGRASLPSSRSYLRKLQQIGRALQLEFHLSKEQILNLYLNYAPFGGTIEGVQAASFTYLDRDVKDLNHAEAALLAVLPQSPTRFRPDLHPEIAQQARDKVLDRLKRNQVWSEIDIVEAQQEAVFPLKQSRPQLAPLLARRLRAEQPRSAKITTTIDGRLQRSLAEFLQQYSYRLPQQSSAALLVIENETAAVKAYIGTANFGNQRRFGHVDMVRATRSPGSALKPFLYGMALDEGLIHSHSLLADVPLAWGDYRPENFDKHFNGPVSAAEALQRSLNVPVIDLLARYGVNRFSVNLANAGAALSMPKGQPNLSIILGGVGSSLERLVTAFRAIGQQGKTKPLQFVQSPSGEQGRSDERYLMSPEAAWVIYQILADVSRPNEISRHAPTISRPSLAWKTGTSYGFRDAWAIGVSEQYTIGVWVGRPDGTPMPGHYGRVSAGPLLFRVVDHLAARGQEPRAPQQPENVREQIICWPLGTAESQQQTEHCHQRHTAWLIDGAAPATLRPGELGGNMQNPYKIWQSEATGLRVSVACGVADAKSKELALWPLVLEPLITKEKRRAIVIPQPDPRCQQTILTAAAPLTITGLQNGNRYRRAGLNEQPPSVLLRSLGGSGKRYWYLNGKFVVEQHAGEATPLNLPDFGEYQLMVSDDAGGLDSVTLFVE